MRGLLQAVAEKAFVAVGGDPDELVELLFKGAVEQGSEAQSACAAGLAKTEFLTQKKTNKGF